MSRALAELPREMPPLPAGPVTVSADVTREEWDGFVQAHPRSSVYHLWDWRHVFESAFRHRTEYLAARRESTIVGVLPLVAFDHWLFGRFMVSLPFVNYGGVLADDGEVARAMVDEAASRAAWSRMSHVELRHLRPEIGNLPRRTHKVTMTRELPASPDQAWEGLDRKVRNQIRKAGKSGLSSEVGGLELLPAFYAVFAENMRDLGTPVYPERWFREMLERFPDRTRVFVVRHGQQPVAAAITLGDRASVEVPSAGSLRAFRAMCPNMLLYWRVMVQAISDGKRVLDFGRSTPGEGTFRFKEQWGAVPGPMTWEYVLMPSAVLPDRSPDNARYRAAIAAWQRLPLALANRLGPSVVRFLP